ncbi:MAG: biotin--[acetyl-CoA-carboxylase] ligase [Dysgonamonadaceae bacterium]|jgi:BirA family biotin operon repressor/biotin-[acetyl-CoA-carboxylase] ligase|nr:biotin--[acetyl-CoA-carboxylase] ligase [Dysgonamonadaceae bacterium]
MSQLNEIIRLDEIDSTNNYLKQLVREQLLAEGTVVIAEFQTGGRGQQGNSWFSSKGDNLLFSLLLCPKKLPANEMFFISCIASLAIERTLSGFIDNVRIKWPNDIYWNDKKIGGILIENNLQEESVKSSVIGIGLNINEKSFPDSLPNPVSLCQITKTKHDKAQILYTFLHEFFVLYQQFKRSEKLEIKKEYMRNLYRTDGYYWFEDGSGKFSAKIADVLPSGHLVLKTREEEKRKYAFKEVQFVE